MGNNNFEAKHPRSTDGKFAEKNRKEAGIELSCTPDDWEGVQTEQETATSQLTQQGLDEAEQVAKCEETLYMLEKTYGLHPDVAKAFKEDGTLYYSERMGGMGILYWVDNKPEYVQAVKDFEKETGGKVYHCVLTHTEFGEQFDLMYIPKKESQKEGDFEALRDHGEAFIATLDEQMPSGYELGYAGYTGAGGGLIRKW